MTAGHFAWHTILKMHYVYVIQNNEGEMYIGYSRNLKSRIKDHNSGRAADSPFGFWLCSSVVEQRTHKPLVVGSNPTRATKLKFFRI